VGYVLLLALNLLVKLTDTILDSISFSKTNSTKPLLLKDIELSKSSKDKRDKDIVKTQIIVFSESQDADREESNAKSLCNAFECLQEDNLLVYKKLKKDNINLLDTKIKGVDTFKIQPREGQNFISLPGREILEEHKIISYTKVQQTQVPVKLQTGYISLGVNEYHNTTTEAFLRDNYDQGNLPIVILGEQGSGKTTAISNYAHNIQKRKEGAIVIDFIKNCELSDIIEENTPNDNLIILDMSDIHSIQGIGYNELKPKTNSPDDLFEISNRKALYIEMLIEAINADGIPLTSGMGECLNAASNVVFLNQEASLKDIIRCLKNHEYRQKCIDNIPMNMLSFYEDKYAPGKSYYYMAL
jgi:hypothetical protein